MNAIRAFIAIELSSEIRQQIDGVTLRLKSLIPNAVRWVPANNIHLTLKFLGESSPANLALLGKSLPAVIGRHQAFTFQVGNLGAFPNIHRPRTTRKFGDKISGIAVLAGGQIGGVSRHRAV